MDIFSIYQHRVKKALEAYEKARTLRHTPSKGYRDTIYRKASPFTNGHFTLAVIGNTSAGKSTFINALLGDRSLLPTAHRQLTCTLTEIEYGDKLQITILYGDGKTKEYADCTALAQSAAIPEQYQHIPINRINQLILAGKSEKEIVAMQAELSDLQEENIDVDVLKRYLKEHKSKSSIPVKVSIKYPLSEAYRGWKIIDTPGVGTVGGIEKETKELLNSKNEFGYNNIDAIVFVNNGLDIQKKEFVTFVKQTLSNINPDARKRIFMVLTHAADRIFIDERETITDNAKRIFVDRHKISPDKLICVDSLCQLFVMYARTHGSILSFKKKEIPAKWDVKIWEQCIDLRNYFKNQFEEDDREVNEESILRTMEKIAEFNKLHSKLDAFVEKEKSVTFQSLMDDINKEVTEIKNDIAQKKGEAQASLGEETLEALNTRLAKKKTELEGAKTDLNDICVKVRDEFSSQAIKHKFERHTQEMRKLRTLESIDDIRCQAEDIMHDVNTTKDNVYESVVERVQGIWDAEKLSKNICLAPIDFESIAIEAVKKNTSIEKEVIGYQKKPVPQKGIWAAIIRWSRIKKWGYDMVNDLEKPIYQSKEVKNDKKAAHEFANEIYAQFTAGTENLIKSIVSSIKAIGDKVKTEGEAEITLQQKSYDQLSKECQSKEAIQRTINVFQEKESQLQNIENQLNELK